MPIPTKYIDNFCNKAYAFPVTLSVIFIFLAISARFGADPGDAGFAITFYQQFFSDPASCEYNFLYYFSGLVGGLVHLANPGGGIFYFKIAGIVVHLASLTVIWQLLKNQIGRKYIIAGAILSTPYRAFFPDFHHNMISALIILISIWAILNGLKKKQILLILLSGMLTGINIFTRLPNITMLILSALIVINAVQNGTPPRTWIKELAAMTTGIITGIMLILLLMAGLNHYDIFTTCITDAMHITDGAESTHSSGHLIFTIQDSYQKIIRSFALLIGTWLYFCIIQRIPNRIIKLSAGAVYAGLMSVIIYNAAEGMLSVIASAYYMLSIFSSIFLLARRDTDSYLKLTVWANLLALIFFPIGSDTYFNLAFDAVYMSIPIILYAASCLAQKNRSSEIATVSISSKALSSTINGTLMFLFLFNIFYITKNSHCDSGWIWDRHYRLTAPLGRNILTTPQRAMYINNAVTALNRYVKPGDYLIEYSGFPILHALTNTRPYIPSPWAIMCYTSPEILTQKLQRAENRTKILPPIFIVKSEDGAPIADFYPRDWSRIFVYKDGDEKYEKLAILYNEKNGEAMRKFIKRHHYGIDYEDEYFIILTPNNKKPLNFNN